ncbi:hypothetical protein NX059_002271 [Plenodomus lindquistii]|nr:hypothetical protein NX059_002271 [Plenodomus lindquistii]
MQDLSLSWTETIAQHAATRLLLRTGWALKVHCPWTLGLQTLHNPKVAWTELASPYTTFVREEECRATAKRSLLRPEYAGYLDATAFPRLSRRHHHVRSMYRHATTRTPHMLLQVRHASLSALHAGLTHLSKHMPSCTAVA